MPQDSAPILAIDCGGATTKAALFDRIRGHYRLLGNGLALTSRGDVSLGVRAAIGDIERLRFRRLLAADGRLIMPPRPDGSGVSAFLLTCSAAPPLRLAVAGTGSTASRRDAHRASQSIHAEIVDVLGLGDVQDQQATSARIRRLSKLSPDAILMVADRRASDTSELVELSKMIAAANPDLINGGRPPVIFAEGDSGAGRSVAEVMEKLVDLRLVERVAPGESQATDTPAAQDELTDVYLERLADVLPGYETLLPPEGSVGVVPTVAALRLAAQFLAGHYQARTVLVDLGSDTTACVGVDGSQIKSRIKLNFGQGVGAARALATVGLPALTRWLPFTADTDALEQYLYNKTLRPVTVPEGHHARLLELALGRELLARIVPPVEWFHQPGLIVASGGLFAHLTHPSEALGVLLDGLAPAGVTRVRFDPLSLLPQVGALARWRASVASEVVERGALPILGTVIAPVGHLPTLGTPALIARIFPEDDGPERVVQVKAGEIGVVPWPREEIALLEVSLAPGLNLPGMKKAKTIPLRVEGGVVGLVFDLRGRPNPLPPTPDRLAAWVGALGV